MAILCLKVPQSIARSLSAINVPGEPVPTDEKHITLLNFGDDMPIDAIGKTVIAVARATEQIGPFNVELNGYGTPFGSSDNGVPVICPVEGRELHDLHAVLSNALTEAGVEFSRKFPEYKPHVTLSWAEEEVQDGTFRTPISWTVTDVVLWCGDHGEERMHTVFDLLG
jgi:2'-5' RNA ligase